MTLGRTSSGAIKIKTDTEGGGLRAVECACCGPTDFQPCRDCPPFLGNLNFSLSGDQVHLFEEYNEPPNICPSANCYVQDFPQNLPPRVCFDSWYADGNGAVGINYYSVSLFRYTMGGLDGCGWLLSLSIQGTFEYCCFYGAPDICGVSGGGIPPKFISGNDPRGAHQFTLFLQCLPPCWINDPPPDNCRDDPFEFNFTVTIT